MGGIRVLFLFTVRVIFPFLSVSRLPSSTNRFESLKFFAMASPNSQPVRDSPLNLFYPFFFIFSFLIWIYLTV